MRIDLRVPGKEIVANRDLHENMYVVLRTLPDDALERIVPRLAAAVSLLNLGRGRVRQTSDRRGREADAVRFRGKCF